MSPQDRLSQVSSHVNYPKGLFYNRLVIITGSGQGIGAECARLFADEGAKVVVSDIDQSSITLNAHCLRYQYILTDDAEKSDSVASSINASHPSAAISISGDVLSATFTEDLVNKAASHGGGKIHVLINNAGYTWDGVIHKMTDKQWDSILAVHNTAPFRLIRACAPYFRVRDGEPRSIINISSTSGLHGNAGQANYSLAKAGVTGLTKAVAKEWGPQFGVRANTVAFGHILTRLTAPKEEGAFVTTPDGTKVALGIPGKQIADRKGGDQQGQGAYKDIPLGRPGTATEAAGAILAVASPYMSYGE